VKFLLVAVTSSLLFLLPPTRVSAFSRLDLGEKTRLCVQFRALCLLCKGRALVCVRVRLHVCVNLLECGG
jgi:hypothetical protein